MKLWFVKFRFGQIVKIKNPKFHKLWFTIFMTHKLWVKIIFGDFKIAIPQFHFITRQEEQLLIASKLKEAIQAQADQNERFSNDFQTVKKRLLRLVFKLMLQPNSLIGWYFRAFDRLIVVYIKHQFENQYKSRKLD